MRLLAGIASAALLLAACGGTASAPSPSPSPTRTSPTPTPTTSASTFKAELKATNQSPPITDAEASCTGNATITITGTSVKFDVSVKGCPATTQLNIAHIHEGAAGVNGPVKISTGIQAGDLKLDSGAVTFTRTASAEAALVSAIIATPSGYYFNIHSTAHAGGVIRGQLIKS